MFKRLCSATVLFAFLFTTVVGPNGAWAQGVFLPEPGSMVQTSAPFVPAMIKGLTVQAAMPMSFDFIVDTGNADLRDEQDIREESQALVKYFLASLTIPENDQWVNLSPYEKDRMMTAELERTVLGRDLLAQDYVLKQVTASIIYPEEKVGRDFWQRVYDRAKKEFGTTDVQVDTFNKVWIVADKAAVYVHKDPAKKGELTAVITDAHLKVMLESDYLASNEGRKTSDVRRDAQASDVNQDLAKQIIREVVVPELEKEVNEGKNFANLRQIYNSVILATWYKRNLKKSFLSAVYADHAKTGGVETASDETIPEEIWSLYEKAYQKGVFNLVREEADALGQMVPRKYVSGGAKVVPIVVTEGRRAAPAVVGNLQRVHVDGAMAKAAAMDQSARVAQRLLQARNKAASLEAEIKRMAQIIQNTSSDDVAGSVRSEMHILQDQLRQLRENIATLKVLGARLDLPVEVLMGDASVQAPANAAMNVEKSSVSFDVARYNGSDSAKWAKMKVTREDLNNDMFRDYDFRSSGRLIPPAVAYRKGLALADQAIEKAVKANNPNRTVVITRDARKGDPEVIDAMIAAFRARGLNVVFTATNQPDSVTSYSWAVLRYRPLMSVFRTSSHVSRPKGVAVDGFKVAVQVESGKAVQSLTTREIKKATRDRVLRFIEHPEEVTAGDAPVYGSYQAVDINEEVVLYNVVAGKILAAGDSLYEFEQALKTAAQPEAVLNDYARRYSTQTGALEGLNIVVEGSHTPSGGTAARVMEGLGANVSLINGDIIEVDGPHTADPSVKGNLVELKKKILANGAHFGIAFDLDGDRGAVVVPIRTENGELVNPDDELADENWAILSPDNLLVLLLPYLMDDAGYNQTGKKVGVIRDVLGTFGVNLIAQARDVRMVQTDAGYVFLKAAKAVFEQQGFTFPIYGEKSGHTWMSVSGEIENPTVVAVTFASMLKQIGDIKSPRAAIDLYEAKTYKFDQSPRFQPYFHPALLAKLSADPRNTTGWKFDPNKPMAPMPQAIIGLGKDAGVKMLKSTFKPGSRYPSPVGDLIIREVNTYEDAPEDGGLSRFADVVFEQKNEVVGRFVFRASSNDPTFVCSYESRQMPDESLKDTNARLKAIAKIVLNPLIDEKFAVVRLQDLTGLLGLPEKAYLDANLKSIEADLDNAQGRENATPALPVDEADAELKDELLRELDSLLNIARPVAMDRGIIANALEETFQNGRAQRTAEWLRLNRNGAGLVDQMLDGLENPAFLQAVIHDVRIAPASRFASIVAAVTTLKTSEDLPDSAMTVPVYGNTQGQVLVMGQDVVAESFALNSGDRVFRVFMTSEKGPLSLYFNDQKMRDLDLKSGTVYEFPFWGGRISFENGGPVLGKKVLVKVDNDTDKLIEIDMGLAQKGISQDGSSEIGKRAILTTIRAIANTVETVTDLNERDKVMPTYVKRLVSQLTIWPEERFTRDELAVWQTAYRFLGGSSAAARANALLNERTDFAMHGGIDFNIQGLATQGEDFTAEIDPKLLEQLQSGGFNGIMPVITHVTPVSGWAPILGFQPADSEEVRA